MAVYGGDRSLLHPLYILWEGNWSNGSSGDDRIGNTNIHDDGTDYPVGNKLDTLRTIISPKLLSSSKYYFSQMGDGER